MKLFLPVLLFFVLSFAAFGQSLELVDPIFEESISTGNTVETKLQIKNNSDHPIRLGVELDDSYHREDLISSICVGQDCNSDFDALEITTLNPGETLDDLYIHFNAGYDELTRELSLTFYEVGNPENRLSERFTYHIENDVSNGILFSNELLQISKVYPNPVSSVASIDYSLYDRSAPATVIVHNILGDRVLELKLDQSETSLKLPVDQFSNGVYFYTLQINGKGVTTKKFLVRK